MQPHQGRGLWILIIDHELDKSEPAQVFSGGSLMTVLVALPLCWVSSAFTELVRKVKVKWACHYK